MAVGATIARGFRDLSTLRDLFTDSLVRSWTFDAFDQKDINGCSGRFEFQTELLTQSRGERRPANIDRGLRFCGSRRDSKLQGEIELPVQAGSIDDRSIYS